MAVDQQRKLLFLAVGQYISPRLLLKRLADLGAKDGMLLNGGGSARWRSAEVRKECQRGFCLVVRGPVATYFGVRAKLIDQR